MHYSSCLLIQTIININSLIHSQVVLMAVTTNGPTTLKNLGAGKTCKKQSNIQMGVCRARPPLSLPRPPGLLGLVWRARGKHTQQAQIIRKQNAHQPRILHFSMKMIVPSGGRDDLVLICGRFIIPQDHYWCF